MSAFQPISTAERDSREAVTRPIPRVAPASVERRWRVPAGGTLAAWLIPFALIVYLGMERGGFEQPVYSQVGIAAWWLVAVGFLAAALPVARVGRSGWIALALLAAFAGWTAIGVSWSSSSGRSVVEVAREVVYVGVFAVALLIGGRGRLRTTIGAVGAGVAVIAFIALLSRLHPAWFPPNELPSVLVGIQSRLAYPIGYWNALAGLIAIGLPLVVWAATSARSTVLRAAAGAAVPVICLASYFTYSRGGLVATVLGLLVFVALSPLRLRLIFPLMVLTLGSGVAIWQASIRHDLADGLTTSTAHAQGDEMLIVVAACAVMVAALIVGIAFLERGFSEAPAVPRRLALRITGAMLVIGLVGLLAVDGPRRVSDGFESFKQPTGLSDTSTRLTSAAGNGRWQYWSAAADAGDAAPLQGIGPGTFVFYWSQNRDINNGFVRDAHSLFVEAYAELGVLGLALIAGFVCFVLGVGIRRTIAAAAGRRAELAAATASMLALTVAAGVDWLWELAVLPIAFLFLAAAVLRADPAEETVPAPRAVPEGGRRGWIAARIVVPLAALGAIAVIAVPMLGEMHVTSSQSDFAAGDLESALSEANAAEDLEPYSAAPYLQKAFVLERMGELGKAASAARAATEREPENWETFFTLSRMQAQRQDKRGAAIRALRRAQELDPFNAQLDPAALAG